MKKKWTFQEAKQAFDQPFLNLLHQAHVVHADHFDASKVQVSTLLSIKTGACPENCSYCPQSAHYQTEVEKHPLITTEEVVEAARRAKQAGSTRFCMGAAWRGPNAPDLERVCGMVKEVKALGLETCATLGLLKEGQAEKLKEAGLDFYNHNIDSSKAFYETIITTRCFEDRVQTLQRVRDADINVCCGGIVGMGETNDDRIQMLVFLANLEQPPESVPINKLIKIPGTPLENVPDPDPFDFVRTIALARILMPTAYVRLSAGREHMSDILQALCFFAGANSLFYGDTLLTANNQAPEDDQALFARLGLQPEALHKDHDTVVPAAS